MKVVVITGASSGIGLACAQLMAKRGHAVVVSARRADRLDAAVAAIQAAGGRPWPCLAMSPVRPT